MLERLESAAVARAVAGLQRQLEEPLEALSNQELKLNDVDAVEAYQVRQQYLSEMAKFQVSGLVNFSKNHCLQFTLALFLSLT